jgi:formimidoylglutamate deiminase
VTASDPAKVRALHLGSALLSQGWADDVRVEIADGSFARIECGVAPQPGDERLALGLPGLPNLHSHAFQRGMAGLSEHRSTQSDSFWSWRELLYRFLAHLTPDDLEAISAQAYMEMLEAGFTRAGEFHYLHCDPNGEPYADVAETSARVAAAAEQTGIALTLLPVFYAHGGFGGAPPSAAQQRFLLDVDRYAALLERARAELARLPHARVGVAPHSLRAVTPSELAALIELAAGGPIHIHVAEQTREVEECLAWSGQRPVEWLLTAADVDRRWCLVHATHMTEAETLRLARSGAVAGLCPITEANLGDGIFPAQAFCAAGGAFGVGSDSNVSIDARGELRMLEYTQRLLLRARNVLAAPGQHTGRALFQRALEGGAQALAAPLGDVTAAPLVGTSPAAGGRASPAPQRDARDAARSAPRADARDAARSAPRADARDAAGSAPRGEVRDAARSAPRGDAAAAEAGGVSDGAGRDATGIAVGAPADLISLDVSGASFAGRTHDRLLDSWIFAAADSCIDRVWRAGVQVVAGGRHRARDAIEARYRRVLERLLRA